MSKIDYDELWNYLSNALSEEEKANFLAKLDKQDGLKDLLEGLKKLEKELPEGMTLRQYLDTRKEYLRKKIFGDKE